MGHSPWESPLPIRYSIRFLTQRPGHPSEPITCAITSTSLIEHLVYKAQSYTRLLDSSASDASSTHSITYMQAGKDLPVTPNVFTALKNLLHAKVDRFFWIGAICSDQGGRRRAASAGAASASDLLPAGRGGSLASGRGADG